MEPCEWCGRPGKVMSTRVRHGDDWSFVDPTLCDVCAALVEIGGGSVEKVDERRRWGQEQVEAELARNWQARAGAPATSEES